MQRRLITVAGAAAAALATAFGASAPASAQPANADSVSATCSGASCAGKSPVSTGCSTGAQTLTSIVVLGAPAAKEFLVELRYSPACLASWTTVTDINQPDCLYSVSAWHEAVNNSSGGRTRTAAVGSGSACSASTVMMNKVGQSTRACAYSTWEGLNRCTAWR